MNKFDLLNHLKTPILKKVQITDGPLEEVTSVLQGASEKSIVFYRLKNDLKSIEMFKERMSKSRPGLVIIDRDIELENIVIVSPDKFNELMEEVLNHFYSFDFNKIKLIGITGTNGKTTTAFLACQIAELLGKKALCIGTLGVLNSRKVFMDHSLTTPSYIEFRKYASLYFKDIDVVFFEFSSHALDQDRLLGLKIDHAAFTNLTLDHLDYHKTEENYFLAKKKILLSLKKDGKLVVPYQEKKLLERINDPHVIKGSDLSESLLPFHLSPIFNRKNLSLALKLNELLWGEFESINFAQLQLPKGRFSVLENKEGFIIIDYAHTPDALYAVIDGTQKSYPEYRVSILFGCGGNRDTLKRKIMGKTAFETIRNGTIYVTTDNPRDELPEKIIEDIIEGLDTKNLNIEVDRKTAVQNAILKMKGKEILIIAGKGHEDYQEIKGVKYPYSDFETVLEVLKEIK